MTHSSLTLLRRSTPTVMIGHVPVGSSAPIMVQSMTNTDTADVIATVVQVNALSKAGSEVVRITVNSPEAAASVAEIRQRLDDLGCNTPLVGDFHFNGERLLKDYPDCAQALAKYRINPGNVGKGKMGDEKFAYMIKQAIEYNKAVRIGVNWGSLDQALLAKILDKNAKLAAPLPLEMVMREALVVSALESADKARELGLAENQLILSCKVSQIQDLLHVYRDLGARCSYPLHLGLTEAGMGSKGIVASSAALAILLQEGLGDTIRISLTPEPNGSRTKEVIVAQELLQTMGLRSFTPLVTACPGCGRTTSTFFQSLAEEIQTHLRDNMPLWRLKYHGVESMTVAVMGCVVNGPGESKMANIGISLPGTGETPVAPVYEDGQKTVTLKGDNMAKEFTALVDAYIARTYGQRT